MANAISIAQGSDFVLDVIVRDKNAVLYDITNTTMTLEVKKRHQDTSAIITKSNGTGITFTDAVNGAAEVDFDPIDTSSLDPGKYEYDIWLELVGGDKVQVVPVSEFRIRARVTVI